MAIFFGIWLDPSGSSSVVLCRSIRQDNQGVEAFPASLLPASLTGSIVATDFLPRLLSTRAYDAALVLPFFGGRLFLGGHRARLSVHDPPPDGCGLPSAERHSGVRRLGARPERPDCGRRRHHGETAPVCVRVLQLV